MKVFIRINQHMRLIIQIVFTALTNGYVNGFLQGTIFKGKSKALCVPGFNCYSCPGALMSCPIGALQAVAGGRKYQFSFFVIGLLMGFGAFFGRFICGWLCPFGLVQDLLHKIPFSGKLRTLPGEKVLRCLKYVILAVFVLILPMFAVNILGNGDPWFCKWICPSGTLFGGVPLVTANPSLQSATGFLFNWKIGILIVIMFLSILVYRPFCRYLCPLGAIYGCFNKVSVYRYRVDDSKCSRCGKCQQVCGMDLPVYEQPNSPECIRCGKCKKICPSGAITTTFSEIYAAYYHKGSNKKCVNGK